MAFVSPIPLLGYTGFDFGTEDKDRALARAKKQLLVESGLEKNSVLIIEGHRYSKNDVLAAFDDLLQPNHLQFHLWIVETEGLTHALQGHANIPKITLSDSILTHPLFESFKDYINTPLLHTLPTAISSAFAKRDFEQCSSFLAIRGLMTDSVCTLFCFALKREMEALTAELDAMADQPMHFQRYHVTFINYQFVNYLNDLPDLLHGERDDLVYSLINLCQSVKKYQSDFVRKTIQSLSGVKCSENLQFMVTHFNAIPPTTNAQEDSEMGASYLTVFMLLIIAILVATCVR
ncbi:MAG: hypothetical protein MUC38_07680 [Cyclobacteriaceae bacterium]|nr:hypothetical protein [Cyclobacteriaceae bacterium]